MASLSPLSDIRPPKLSELKSNNGVQYQEHKIGIAFTIYLDLDSTPTRLQLALILHFTSAAATIWSGQFQISRFSEILVCSVIARFFSVGAISVFFLLLTDL